MRNSFLFLAVLGMPAVALAETPAADQSGFVQIGLLVAMVLVFYFLLWRPQSKRNKAQKEMIASLKVGDPVLLSSGIAGVIEEMKDEHIYLRIAKGVVIQVQKNAATAVYPVDSFKEYQAKE